MEDSSCPGPDKHERTPRQYDNFNCCGRSRCLRTQLIFFRSVFQALARPCSLRHCQRLHHHSYHTITFGPTARLIETVREKTQEFFQKNRIAESKAEIILLESI